MILAIDPGNEKSAGIGDAEIATGNKSTED
jgi:hypothetical protein